MGTETYDLFVGTHKVIFHDKKNNPQYGDGNMGGRQYF